LLLFVSLLHYSLQDFTMPFEGGNKSKGFCFIEYENPESAHQALTQMGGFQFAGRAIKVRANKDA
jgi:RNA recognition motif-containing protein